MNKMIYFDNAATTFPKPPNVLPAVRSAILRYGGNPGRSGHRISLQTAEKVYETRKKAADFFGAEVENTVFTLNCTHALNMAIKGIMKGGGHAITSCLEHNSVLRPLHALYKEGMIEYSVADVTGNEDEIIANLERELRPNTKVIVITHASNVTGKVMPIERIATLCRLHRIKLVVDAAQTAGIIPIDVKRIGINLLCAAGHKGLYGTTGTGVMILNDTEPLKTLMEGGTGSASGSLDQPEFHPDRYESGTVNTCGILALSAGLDFVKKYGVDRLYRHELGLCQYLLRRLKGMEGITLYQDDLVYGKNVPIVLFNVAGLTSMMTTEQLNKAGFAVRGGLHCAPLVHQKLGTEELGAVRFSPSAFNSYAEIELFIDNLKKIVKNKGNLLEIQ